MRPSRRLVAAVAAAASLAAAAGVAVGLHAEEPHARSPAGEARLDLSTDGGRPAAFLRDFDPGSIYYGAAPDRIRAIDEPRFETPAEAERLLHDTDLVVGVEHGGEAHAYPLKLLAVHEVVNDVVGGLPVAVTWCPLCRTASAFDRRIDGRARLFGVSGLLYRGNLILFERETGSLFSQLLGGAVSGPLRGTRPRAVPVVHETWAAWRGRHPDAPVLSVAQDEEAERFTAPTEVESTYGTELSDAPFAAYASKVPYYFRRETRGLADAALVVGVELRGRAKAWELAPLRAGRVREDALAGEPLLLVHADDDALWAAAFSRRLDGRTLGFRLEGGTLRDRQTGSTWRPADMHATVGPLAGASLRRLPSTTAYWFAWRGLYPRTELGR